MQTAIIIEAEIIDNQTIHLLEPIRINENRHIKVIIEESNQKVSKRIFGCAKDWIEISPDFNEPLEDFKEYM